jgi:type II secretory pathway pseudopilin PulG
MGKRGYTIFEILITLVVSAGLILVLALNNSQFGRTTEGRGIANATLSELRAARSYAQQNQTNVALAFSPQGAHFFRRFQGQQTLVEERPINLVARGSGVVLWPDLTNADEGQKLPPGVDGSELDGLGYVLFTPDGRVFGNGPLLDGNTVLLTCVSYDGQITGDRVKVNQVRNARVLLLSPNGSVTLSKSSPTELENLPDSETVPTMAELGEPAEIPTAKPIITNIEFSPRRVRDSEPVGLGRSFIEIHPLEDAGGRKEFPTLNITVTADSPSGVPIFATGTVTEGDGEGFFANIEEVELALDSETGRRTGTLSWKPPYEAVGGNRFTFEVLVKDNFGNSTSVETHAGLALQAEILPDLRLLICTSDGQIFRTNSQGGERFDILQSGPIPQSVFWSPDGTMFYILGNSGKLTRYMSDGSLPTEMLTAPGGAVNYSVDPFGMYLAYTAEPTTVDLVPLITPTPAPSATPGPSVTPAPVETDTSYKLQAVNLNNPTTPLVIEQKASANFSWSTEEPGALHFQRRTLEFLNGDTEPPEVVIHHDYTDLEGTEPTQIPRVDSPAFPAVSGGIFSPYKPEIFARIVKPETGNQKLVVMELDENGEKVWSEEVLTGSNLRDLSWSQNQTRLLIVRDNELVEVAIDVDANSTSGPTSVMDAAGKSNFQLAPEANILFYLEGGALKSRIDDNVQDVSVLLPDGVQVVDYAVTD